MTVRAHADGTIVSKKLSRLDEPHIAALTDLARCIQKKHLGVPYFDPDNGGVNASVLVLLEAPGPQATCFVSQDNDDQTAENLNRLMAEAGLLRREIVMWNVVPFYIGMDDRTKLRAAGKKDIDAGRPWLRKLLSLLPHLSVVVLLGRKAQSANHLVSDLAGGVRILRSWHPSSRSLNRDRTRRGELLQVLVEAGRGSRMD